uniref:hypothetical protein n=1 Tax=Gracilaria multipartita TaxID=172945 RepID=UPI001D102D6B|nr:hypothetical protein LK227_pgp151 [Gracilaria multipartita]UAD86367.1 hypothetical protein [Gracilaria multipartita]
MKNLLPLELQQKISKQKAVKIITGLSNFSIDSILKIVKAAEIGQASYVDVAANPKIISIVKSVTSFPLCVSSIEPLELLNCVMKGADIVEVGNFDVFYGKKIFFSSEQILNLAQETRELMPNIPICVTIPHTLLLSEQIRLAVLLEKIGVSLIQTEGYSTKNSMQHRSSSIMTSMTNASSTISSSYVLSKYINIPIIVASGINCLSATIAFSYGASAIGIGSAVSKYDTVYDMAMYIHEIVCSIKAYSNKSIASPHLFRVNDINYINC